MRKLLPLATLSVFLACNSVENPPQLDSGAAAVQKCVPNDPAKCQCGDLQGNTVCLKDGTDYYPCLCPAPQNDAGAPASVSVNQPVQFQTRCGQTDIGECEYGFATWVNGVMGECLGEIDPKQEICNGLDDDCDGVPDDGLVCECRPDSPPLPCGSDIGECRKGGKACISDGKGGFVWDQICQGETKPTTEILDGKDNDCNGNVDDPWNFQTDVMNCGGAGKKCELANASASCVGGNCQYKCLPHYYDMTLNSTGAVIQCGYFCSVAVPAAKEDCATAVDDNCDGQANEGCDYTSSQLNCGTLGHKCQYPNGYGSCIDGDCQLTGCVNRYFNVDGIQSNGCEYYCPNGSPTSVEVCGNEKDDNCDGRTDENCECDPKDPHPVQCSANGNNNSNTGICRAVMSCQNGKYSVCMVVQPPLPRQCNEDGLDRDCDGLPDIAQFDLKKDPKNCGKCGNACSFAHAAASCADGTCKMGDCDPNWHNFNGQTDDGCEKACTPTNNGIEQCDGIDNDCNGKVDDNAVCACTAIGLQKDCGSNVGACKFGKTTCAAPGNWSVCDMSTGVGPKTEICNGVDDDCDGAIDNGFDLQKDPNNCGACNVKCSVKNGIPSCVGGKCGIAKCDPGFYDSKPNLGDDCDVGPCVKTGAETCNGLDDDCNGLIDDGIGVCACVVGSTQICGKNVGACHAGTQKCVAPGVWDPTCSGPGYVSEKPEICNGLDDDCDGTADNGFDKLTDAKNCGGCGIVCSFAHAAATCQNGVCKRGNCIENWYSFDGIDDNGCEKSCVVTNGGVEQCDGIDNDCNGKVDETFNMNTDPANCGACGNRCSLPNVLTNVCSNGNCAIGACQPGWINADGIAANGCERPEADSGR